jgi:hypothetical protein
MDAGMRAHAFARGAREQLGRYEDACVDYGPRSAGELALAGTHCGPRSRRHARLMLWDRYGEGQERLSGAIAGAVGE